jgi:hypothetical protein
MKTIAKTIEDELESISLFEKAAKDKIANLETKIVSYTKSAWTFVIGGIVALIFPIISNVSGRGYAELNLLGDYAGGIVASSWTLSGVFFIYVAFLGQKLQSEQQQIEIRHAQGQTSITRLELKEQRFENTFFLMLQFQNEILSVMDFKAQGKEISKGRDVFRTYYRQLRNKCLKIKREAYIRRKGLDPHVAMEQSKFKHEMISFSDVLSAYVHMYDKREGDLGHYFRNLYNIIRYVSDSLGIADKEKYFKILIGMLSSYELIHLYYYARSEKAPADLAKLLKDYKFIDQMPKRLMIDRGHESIAYPRP